MAETDATNPTLGDMAEGEHTRSAWWQHLVGRPFYWVLDGAHPAADSLMLRDVLERPTDAPAVSEARLRLREWRPVRRLVAALTDADAGEDLLEPRYRTTFWRLRLLAELGVVTDEEPVAEAVDRTLDAPFDESHVTNLNAVLLFIPLSLGYGNDPRVVERVSRLRDAVTGRLWPEGIAARADWLAQAVATLSLPGAAGLVELSICRQAGDALLSLPLRDLGPRWQRFGFPIFDQPDALFTTRYLLKAGIDDPRLQPWVDVVAAAQEPEGGWKLDRALPTDPDLMFDSEGSPSRWISAQGIYVLRAYYGE